MDTRFEEQHWTPETVAVDKKRCLFCSGPLAGAKAREHVFPRWLLRHFDVEAQQVRGRWMASGDKFSTKDVREQILSSFVHGQVCATCNNGWMSALEVEVKELLVALASGERSPELLRNDERRLLARWTVKTAAALNHASNFHTLVPYEQAAAVQNGPPVDGTSVFARLMPEQYDPLSWHQALVAPALVPQDMTKDGVMEEMRRAWRTVLVVGRLLLMAAYWPPDGEWVLSPNHRVHVPVWPVGTSWPVHDNAVTTREELPAETLYFLLDLFVVPRSDLDQYGTVEIPSG